MRDFVTRTILILAAGSLFLAGCSDDDSGVTDGDPPPDDVAVQDTGEMDSGETDTGEIDAGEMDGGAQDTTADVQPDTAADGGGTDATATIQVFHNSPDPNASEVDVWIRDGSGSASAAIDDFAFRQYTERLEVPAETEWDLVLAAADSNDSSSDGGQSLASSEVVEEFTNIKLDEDTNTVATVEGVVDPSNFEESGTSLNLNARSGARTTSGSGEPELLVVHGAPDAPAVDLAEMNGLGDSNTTVADGLTYGSYAGNYVEVQKNMVVDVGTDSGDFVTNVQVPDASDFESGTGGVWTVAASGFLTPGGDDATGGSEGAALRFAAFPNTGSPVSSLPVSGKDATLLDAAARGQILHAATASAVSDVDITVDGTQVASGLSVGSGTGFLSLPVGLDLGVDIDATGGSASASVTVNLSRGGNADDGEVLTRALVAAGDISNESIDVLPAQAAESRPTAPAAPANQVALNAVHAGAAPALNPVDISIRNNGSAVVGPLADVNFGGTIGIQQLQVTDAETSTIRLSDGSNDFDFEVSELASQLPSGASDLEESYVTFVAVDGISTDAAVQVHAFTEDGSGYLMTGPGSTTP